MADQNLVQTAALNESECRQATGFIERVIPGETDGQVLHEHIGRYEFASRFVKGKDVLDAACGAGYGAEILCAAGARSYLGIDISPEAIQIANARYRCSHAASFTLCDACSLDGVKDKSIDVAVSFETIEHLEDPASFLANLRRVLRPGAILIISTPNRDVYNPSGGLGSKPLNPYHIREWGLSEFTDLLQKFFEVDQVLGQSPYPRWKTHARRFIANHPNARCLETAYRALKRTQRDGAPSRLAHSVAVPVQTPRRWQYGTYIVCLCRTSDQS